MAYAFPELESSELIANLDQLFSIQIDERFLKKPEAVQWQRMLSQMLLTFTGCSEDTFLKQQRLTTDFEHVELHTESIPLMHLILSLKTVMKDIACSDFTPGDLFKPTPSKVKRICSALINAMRFKMMRVPYVTQIQEEAESERETYQTVQKEIEELKMKINQIKAQKAEQEPELNKVKEENEATAIRVSELADKKTKEKKEIAYIKNQNAERNTKAGELKDHIMQRKDDVELLSQKIVQSPTKVQAEHENLNQQLLRLADTQNAKRQRIGELAQMIGAYEQYGAMAGKGCDLLEAINGSVNKENELDKEIGKATDKIQDLLQEHEDLNRKKTQIHESLQSKQDKVVRLACQHQSRMAVLQKQQELLKQDKDCYMKKQDSVSAKRSDMMQYQKSLEIKDKKEEQMVEEWIERIKDLYSQLLAASDESHQNIDINWQKAKASLNKLRNH